MIKRAGTICPFRQFITSCLFLFAALHRCYVNTFFGWWWGTPGSNGICCGCFGLFSLSVQPGACFWNKKSIAVFRLWEKKEGTPLEFPKDFIRTAPVSARLDMRKLIHLQCTRLLISKSLCLRKNPISVSFIFPFFHFNYSYRGFAFYRRGA